MPVSLERLIAEVEPAVITEELTRECIEASWGSGGAHDPSGKRRAARAAPLPCRAHCRQATPAQPTLAPPPLRQVPGTDADISQEKRRILPFSQVEVLAFSFRNLARITSLNGLEGLTKLQLDNNKITRIENIGHLVIASTLWARGNCGQRPPVAASSGA
jgi:hypothetical protein